MKIIKITRKIFIYIRSYYFNIKYLPINQAIKLPIILENVKVSKGGKIIIQSDYLYKGMIRLGTRIVGVFPDTGLTLENNANQQLKTSSDS